MGGVHLGLSRAPLIDFALLAHAIVVRSASGFQFQPPLALPVVKPVQNLFVLVRRHHLLLGNVDPATHRHQQEGMESVHAQVQRQLQDGGQLVEVVPGDGGIDLGRDANRLHRPQSAQRALKAAADTAEAIVGGAVGPVQADGHPADTGIADAPGDLGVNQSAVGGQRHQQAALVGVGGDGEDVFAEERFATAQDQDWVGITRDLLDDLQGVGR